jgi:hypothetical protein
MRRYSSKSKTVQEERDGNKPEKKTKKITGRSSRESIGTSKKKR